MLKTRTTKAGWTTVAFGDVVRQVKDKVDPEESGLDRYVAGEHMDTDDLRIRRWGEIGDGYLGPAFHMRFKPGHVLYGSRRTYLRKVALADFEGVTANTTYVLESKDPKILLPELLPFLMQAEPFHEHSNRESKGSVNPYVNFSDLAWYEFTLPPLEEQRRIVEAIHCAIVHIDKLVMLQEASVEANASVTSKAFAAVREDYPSVRFADVCLKKPQSGIYKSEQYRGRGVPMVNMGELFANDIITSTIEMERVQLDESELGRYMLTPNDLLFGRRSVVLEGAGRCVLAGTQSEPMVFESSVLRATLDADKVDNRFVFEWFRSPLGNQQVRRIVTFTTVSGVAGSDVARLPVPLPPLDVQKRIANRLSDLREKIGIPTEHIEEAKALARAILRRVLETA